MKTLDNSRREPAFPAPLRRRDKLLGLAALVLALRKLLEAVADAGLNANSDYSGHLANAILFGVAMVVMAAGYSLAGIALLGSRSLRVNRLRLGAYILGCAHVILIGQAVLSGFRDLLYPLFATIAFFWLARAFPKQGSSNATVSTRSRNKLLGEAGVVMALAAGLGLLVNVLYFVGNTDTYWLTPREYVIDLASYLAWLAAFVVGARVFLLASRPEQEVRPGRQLAQRDGRLVRASVLYALSGALSLVASSLWLLRGAPVEYYSGTSAYAWLLVVSQAGLLLTGCIAAIAFRLTSSGRGASPSS